MSVAQFAPAALSRGSSRWLLLGSLALNLFFVGIAVAMAIRTPAPPTWDRDVFVRVERIAATLPAADADLLRGEVKARRPALENAQHQFPRRVNRSARRCGATRSAPRTCARP